MACSKQYVLTKEEKSLMKRCDMEDDIGSETRKMNRRIKKCWENWTKCDGTYSGINGTSVLLFGTGGAGKSALGNVLVGRNVFKTANKASSETSEISPKTGWYGEQKVTVYDTPGYMVRKIMEKETDPSEAAKGMEEIEDGIHVFILVINGSQLRNLETEAEVIKKARLLNRRTFKHCILAVTHAGSSYVGKTVDDFMNDASKSPGFSKLMHDIEGRVVLVELGDGSPLDAARLMTSPFYSGDKESARDMVFNMTGKVLSNNTPKILYKTADIMRDLSVCFPPLATIITPVGKKTMEDLQLNDDVLIVNPQGQVQYEKVIMFSHANPSQMSYFCTITTEDGKVLQLSPGHLLHVGKIGKLTAAQDVQVGDVVFTCAGNQNLKSSLVTTISGEWLTGIYCPHTPSGSIIVDGVAASCYTNLLSPTLAHAAMFPVRVAHRLLPDDWFKWMMPYNKEEGMPSLALRVSKMMKWA